jgi:RimJ/RimL family protein N-acetyltransferase
VAAYVEAVAAERERQRSDLPPLVDGLGARRVAEAIIPSSAESLGLRQAELKDMDLFFHWRNEPTAREFSLSNASIPWNVHRAWFTRRIAEEECDLAVVEAGGLPVGQFRLDYAGSEAALSYSLDPVVRGRGWGKWLVAAAMRRASRRVASVRAEVRFNNVASRRIFTGLGFSEGAESDGRVVFRRRAAAASPDGYADSGERS